MVSPLALDILGLVAVAVLVFLNGFFVAAEFALVKVRRTQLAERENEGDARAARAIHLSEHLDAYLSACQLGITFASLGLGWIGEPAIARLLEPAFLAAGITSTTLLHTAAFAVAFTIITILHIVLGELLPKSLAIRKATPVSLWSSRPLHVFYVVFKPLIWTLNGAANALLRFAGLSPATSTEVAHSEEELRLILAESAGGRHLTKERAETIMNLFDLKTLTAAQVMTPRRRVAALDVSRSFEDNWALADEQGYSRFPLVDGNLDNVVGMVHYRDLAALARSTRTPKDVASIRRDVLFVPEGKRADSLMTDLIRQGRHMAIVLDQFGTTVGLVTLEDLFEELFGEIRDEFDIAKAEVPYRRLGEGHYLIDAQMPLRDANALLGTEFERSEVATFGGWVVSEVGHLPGKGERVRLGPYEAIVREADRKRVKLIEVALAPDEG